jgi:hypothetical protein
VDQGIYAQIDGFCRLRSNWDGEDAPAVTKEAADRARVLLREVLAAAQARGLAPIPFPPFRVFAYFRAFAF